jgi:hypothetical protein
LLRILLYIALWLVSGWFITAFPRASLLLLLLLLGIGAIAWLVANRQTRLVERSEAGQCLNCGYDLRATPHRCPECGFPETPPTDLRLRRIWRELRARRGAR